MTPHDDERTAPPYIDPDVRFVGISKLRRFDADRLRALRHTFVFQDGETPLAVLLRYETFLSMQEEIQQFVNHVRHASQEPPA